MSLPSQIPPSPADPTLSSPIRQDRPRRWTGIRWLRWLLLLTLIGWCLTQIPREVGRWQLAAALQSRAAGHKSLAYSQLEAALRWYPSNPALLLQRAEWRLADGQEQEALADADRIAELKGKDLHWLMIHSQFLQNAGHFADAVEDWKKIDQISQRRGAPSRATALNGLAYAQALGKVELDQALEHVSEALELSPGNAAVLDTRGFLLYLTGRYEAALADMNLAVKGMEGEVRPIHPSELLSAGHTKLLASEPRAILETAESRNPATAPSRAAQAVAVVRYHRALVLQALQHEKEAEVDLARVRQLIGRDPDETLF